MTEYTINNNTPLTELTDWVTARHYVEQAKEIYFKNGADGMTFLPMAKGYNNIMDINVATDNWGHPLNNSDKNVYSYIVQKTLEKTFEQGNPEHDSALITAIAYGNTNGNYRTNDTPYLDLTARAIDEYMHQDKEWFSKLTPEAQLAAVGMLPKLQYEESLKLDFADTQEGNYDRQMAAAGDLVLRQAYNRIKTGDGADRVQPKKESRFEWKIIAAALEAQLKSHTNEGKIPSAPVFMDLMATAEKSEQLNKLTELTREPQWKNILYYGSYKRGIAQAFNTVAACGKATQKFFYEAMYSFDLYGNTEPNLEYRSMNYQTLQAAKAELRAQKAIDDVKKNNSNEIIAVANINDVVAYRPNFFEQTEKMTPTMCANVLKEHGDRISPLAQFKMMIKVLDDKIQGFKNGYKLYDNDYKMLNSYLKRAARINTLPKMTKKFIETIRPVAEQAKQQYDNDKSKLAEAVKARIAYTDANNDYELFNSARNEFCDLLNKGYNLGRARDNAGMKEPTEEALNAFFAAVKEGKVAKLEFTPKSGLGKLFMSKKMKEAQDNVLQLTTDLNTKITAFARMPEFKYIKEVGDDNTYYKLQNEKYEDVETKSQNSRRYFEKDLANEVAAFEQSKIEELLDNVEAQYNDKLGDIRANLSMKFDGQEFNGKPMPGLVKEEQMAQEIYKGKISKLRQAIQDGIKQDMLERGVNQKPDKENPNATGKPMTIEGTKEIRRNIKNLHQYETLVH